MPVFPHLCDGCGEKLRTKLVPTENSVVELCAKCRKEKDKK